LLLGAALATASVGRAAAQGWPDRPIRFINPWPPGGPADLVARPLAQRLSETLGKPMVMENRPGANGTIATGQAARAAPDGYSVLFAHAGPITIAPNFQANIAYDPERDLLPVTQLVSSPLVLVTRGDLGAADVPGLIAKAKAAREPLTYGSVGPASTTHLAGEMLARRSGAPLLHVPYTGSTQPIIDMMAGRIDIGLFNIGAVMEQVRAGRIRALAVSTLRRSGRLPELPTVAETYPGFEVNSWYGVMLPAGTPPGLVERFHQEFTAALRVPEIARVLAENGLDVEGTAPDAFGRKIGEDLRRWRELAQTTGIRVD
jgi:tripartite-type tricarboxylate transporter receptor subunit TctC